jgi:voltage-dependent potassium channel beta subunit
MEYRRLGSAGLHVSALSFGSWVTFGVQYGEKTAYQCMRTAFDAGVNFFDNAEAYAGGKAETIMGNVIKRAGWRRSEIVVSTKLIKGGPAQTEKGLSRKHVIEGTNASLKRLQLDYVDLLFCHRPDPNTPIEETVRAMNHVINQGKAFYWGTSEWSHDQIREAYEVARRHGLIPPTMEQPQYNMFNREKVEKEFVPLYKEGLGLTTWSPLESGLLTGKYGNGIPEGTRVTLEGYKWLKEEFEKVEGRAKIETVKKIEPIAKELGVTMAQLAIAWCLKNPNVSSVITGASKPDQVSENMRSIDAVEQLTPEVMTRIDSLLHNRP